MLDPLSVSTSVVGGALAIKLLGPSAELLGVSLRNFLDIKGRDNVEKILQNAINKLGNKIDTNESVSPRILKQILSEGAFSDDPVSIEYYGGILAASRSQENNDDTSVSYLKIIENLSTIQIRAHCIIYNALYLSMKTHRPDQTLLPEHPVGRVFYLQFDDLFPNIDDAAGESYKSNQKKLIYTCNHISYGLNDLRLIDFFLPGEMQMA